MNKSNEKARPRDVSLSAIASFEAAARHANFTKAGKELGVTQAAVSKQVALLESQIGTLLFRRTTRAVTLTVPGRQLYDAVSEGLSRIYASLETIQRTTTPVELTITTTIAAATLWLMQLIAAFRSEHPGNLIKVIASDTLSNLGQENIDIAIRYGAGQWADTDAVFLFGISFFPVCSPAYLEQNRIETGEDLYDQKLLDLDGPVAGDATWADWFRSQNLTRTPIPIALSLNNYPVLVQSAVAGQGVILGWEHIIEDQLRSGLLVRVFNDSIPARHSYYFVRPKHAENRPELDVFRDWLFARTKHLR